MIKIALASIMLGVAVMMISVSVLRGFQNEIREKIVGFGSHIVVTKFSASNALETTPIEKDENLFGKIQNIKGVSNVQAYAYKGALVKTDDQLQGIVFKGVEQGFDSSFFKSNLKEGNLFKLSDSVASNDIIISSVLSRKLKLKSGDKLRTFFSADTTYRVRAFNIAGIYETGLSEFDNKFVVGDLRQIQRINNWNSDEIEGIEILITNFDNLDKIALQIYENTPPDLDVSTIRADQPGLFSWLELLNTNVIIILLVMALVATASIISTLLVMIFEKTSMIGILKTLGSTDKSIRKLFLIKSSRIILQGVLYGTLIAFALCWIQSKFKLLKLDPESYSMSYVPIDLSPWIFILVAAGAFIVCVVVLLIPTNVISKISPAKTLRFD
ncbi:ABC transporter permease [Bacteroidales bacterium OttesenSCG-928-C19]|nr:ABC transporter permease [Bacteroidales bacterium OttesenSCG-928-C19]